MLATPGKWVYDMTVLKCATQPQTVKEVHNNRILG